MLNETNAGEEVFCIHVLFGCLTILRRAVTTLAFMFMRASSSGNWAVWARTVVHP